jgi:hypothetical protein
MPHALEMKSYMYMLCCRTQDRREEKVTVRQRGQHYELFDVGEFPKSVLKGLKESKELLLAGFDQDVKYAYG